MTAPPAASLAGTRVPVLLGSATTPDGATLSYRLDGDGPGTPVVLSNGIGVSTFFWRHLVDHLTRVDPRRPVLTWDYRGHGRSPVPPDPDALTVVGCARDLWTVADAAGLEDVVLGGHSMGCQVILEACRLKPGRVRALVPVLGASGRVMESFLGGIGGYGLDALMAPVVEIGARNPKLAESMLRRVLQLPGVWQAVRALGVVHPDLCPREEFEPYFAHLRTLDLRTYFALARDLLTHDASDMLGTIAVPTLVIAGESDLFTPLARSQELASRIAGAELLVVRGGSHAALVEQPELIALAVEKLLRRAKL